MTRKFSLALQAVLTTTNHDVELHINVSRKLESTLYQGLNLKVVA